MCLYSDWMSSAEPNVNYGSNLIANWISVMKWTMELKSKDRDGIMFVIICNDFVEIVVEKYIDIDLVEDI